MSERQAGPAVATKVDEGKADPSRGGPSSSLVSLSERETLPNDEMFDIRTLAAEHGWNYVGSVRKWLHARLSAFNEAVKVVAHERSARLQSERETLIAERDDWRQMYHELAIMLGVECDEPYDDSSVEAIAALSAVFEKVARLSSQLQTMTMDKASWQNTSAEVQAENYRLSSQLAKLTAGDEPGVWPCGCQERVDALGNGTPLENDARCEYHKGLASHLAVLRKDAESCLCTSEAREHAADVSSQLAGLRAAATALMNNVSGAMGIAEHEIRSAIRHTNYVVIEANIANVRAALSASQERTTTE